MSCKEKYSLTPKQTLSIYEGRCCNKARYLLEMRKDAFDELEIEMKLKDESNKAMTIPNFDKLVVPLFNSQPITIIQSFTQMYKYPKDIEKKIL